MIVVFNLYYTAGASIPIEGGHNLRPVKNRGEFFSFNFHPILYVAQISIGRRPVGVPGEGNPAMPLAIFSSVWPLPF